MRISSNLFFQTGLNSINAQQADLVHLYKQVGSGKRMVSPSDDPLAAAQAINVSQTLAMSERYAANRQVATQNLGMQENVLNSVTLQLQDVKTRLVEAGNGTLSQTDRATLADVLELARENLLSLGNSTDGNGQYLFSGAKGNIAPFGQDGSYAGDSLQRLIQVDQTRQIAGGDIGTDIFSRAAPGTIGYVTRPGGANTGTAAVTGYDMTNATGLAAGRTVQIEFIASTDPLNPPGTLAYQVTIPTEAGDSLVYEVDFPVDGGGALADPAVLMDAELGLTITLNGTPQIGDSFEMVPMHSAGYTLGSSAGATSVVRSVTGYEGQSLELVYGDIIDPLEPLDPSDPGYPSLPLVPGFTVSGLGGATVQYPADIDAVTGRVSVQMGGMEIEFDAEPAVGDSFTVSPTAGSQSRDELNFFGAIDDIVAALRNPGTTAADHANLQNALNSALQRVDVTYNNVLSIRASAGTRMNEISALDSSGATRVLDYRNQLSKLEDLDYYTAITQLQLRTTALEAAAMAFQKIQNTSLFNLSGR